jgi:hypothetical protein
MTDRDWDFCIGDLGNPLADIHDWMLQPYPAWMPKWQRQGKLKMGDEPTYICRNCGEPCTLRLIQRNFLEDDGYQDIYYISDCCNDDYYETEE